MTHVRILAAVDGSPITDVVLAHTAELARRIPDAELHVVHAVEVALVGGVESGVVPLTVSLVDEKKFVQRAATELSQKAGRAVLPHLRVDTAWHGVVQCATDIEATLIVVGTHDRRGLSRLLVGSVTDVIVRSAPCAVLVARERAHRADVPSIEPACPDCLAKRAETAGKTHWCDRHQERHGRAHVYGDSREGYGAGAEFFQS
ncbi:MAG: universal stress protein [Polyangiaceae bacterium]|nr:universal stress protein [Polyangiaceae bacterium]